MVARLGSFVAAARALHLSQPALGQQVKALEDRLGVRLLERHSRGVKLSEAGAVFLQEADGILEQVQAAERALDRFRAKALISVKIGVTPTPGRMLVPQLLAACDAHGQLRIWVRQGLSEDLISQVSCDELDMALCYEAPRGGAFEGFPLCSEDLFLVGSPGQVDAAAGPVDFNDLAGLPLVLDERFHASRRQIETVAMDRGVSLNVSHEIEPINLKRELLIRHNRCSIVPYGLFLDEIGDGQLSARRIVNPTLSRTLFLVVRRGVPRETTDLLLEMLIQLVSKQIDKGDSGWGAYPPATEEAVAAL